MELVAGCADLDQSATPCAGGILESVSETVIALEVKEGAHHLDLMWAENEDPQSVRDVRDEERASMKRWIKDFTSTQSEAERTDNTTGALTRGAPSA